MKLTVKQNAAYGQVEITILCPAIGERLSSLIRQIQLYDLTINAKKDGRSFKVTPDSIFYFESLEEKTWLYLKSDVLICSEHLYELELLLENTSFTRISKSCLLNTAVVESVRPLLGRRLEALLDNGEKLIVNRHYVPGFKMKFGLEDSLI